MKRPDGPPTFWSRLRAALAPRATAAPAANAAPTQRDTDMMRLAIDQAREAQAIGEVPIGAIVYRTATGEIVGRGHNRRETDKDPAAHAEHIAMLEAARATGDWRLNDCTVVVTLEPCPMCAGLIVNARLGRVVYGAPDPKAGAVRTLYHLADDQRLNHRAEIIPGVLADECGELLTAFFRDLRHRQRRQRPS